MKTIVVVDYDPAWPAVFEQLRSNVWPSVKEFALSIEHVGSTAVPGLAAKPVIDIDLVVPAQEQVAHAIEALTGLGYEHRGDLGVEGREAFGQPDGLRKHHMYVCLEGTLSLINHLSVRDYLRTHPAAATEYGELKKRLAREFTHDIDAYIDGKTDFILEILRNVGLEKVQLAAIELVNRQS